jgi:hypothetical protein
MSLAPPTMIAMKMVRCAMESKMLAVSARRVFARYHQVAAQMVHFSGQGVKPAKKRAARMQGPVSGLGGDVGS